MVVDFTATLAPVAMPVWRETQAHAKSVIVGYQTDNQSLLAATAAALVSARHTERDHGCVESPATGGGVALCLVITSSADWVPARPTSLGVSSRKFACPGSC
jgi:hypothetical protein